MPILLCMGSERLLPLNWTVFMMQIYHLTRKKMAVGLVKYNTHICCFLLN